MKRQRGRNRKPGGGGGGGGSNPNRAFDSNGPEGIKVRGNAQHIYERYLQLARDATSAGDRVLAENFMQHAEHYFRLIRAMQPQRPVSDIAARDAFSSGFDIDFEDESGMPQGAPDEAEARQGGDGDGDRNDGREEREGRRDRAERDGGRDRERFDRDRGDRDRDRGDRGDRDRDRGDFRREERAEGREERGADEGRRESRRERFERQRAERGERSDRGERRTRQGDEPREGGDPLAVVQPQGSPLVERTEEASPVLRAEDGGESHMPAFLGRAAPTGEDEPKAEKPKRAPRRRKAAEEPQAEDA